MSSLIDPLIDDASGFQVAATRSMQEQIVQLLSANYPQFEIREFTQENIARGPLVLLGSLAGINKEGKVAPQPESYRIWLVLADLKSGKIVGKATARAASDGIDRAPAPFFNDSPTWTDDRYIDAYLKTCGGKLGAPIDPVYLDGILTAALVGSAIEAYDAGDYAAGFGFVHQRREHVRGRPAACAQRHLSHQLATWTPGSRLRKHSASLSSTV